MSGPKLVLAALVLAASVIAFALSELATQGNHAVRSTPEFLTRALGASQPHASLVRSPTADVQVSIHDGGFSITSGTGSLGLTSSATAGGSWIGHRQGATRATSYGSESVVVGRDSTEHFQTVETRQGPRNWRWKISTGLDPRITRGYVGFFSGSELVPLTIDPVQILDRHGRKITPKGLEWGIDHTGGSSGG